MGKQGHKTPVDLVRGAARFARWRQGRALGKRIPEPLWNLAVALAVRHGVSRTASALRVDYYALKKRSGDQPPTPGEDSAPSAPLVELAPTAFATSSECVIEFEKTSGAKLRMHVPGPCLLDLAALGRGFWEAR